MPKNTVLGSVNIQAVGFPSQACSVRFANNQMDKVNLPIPDGVQGPATYDNSCLLFERKWPKKFRLTLGTAKQRRQWVAWSKSQKQHYTLSANREFGFF